MRASRWAPLLAILVVSGLFAYFNGGQRISLNLGFTVLYRISLVGVVFGAFILGMISMFIVGLRHDLRLRQQLRDRGLLDRPMEAERPPRGEPQTRHDEPRTPQWGPPV